MNDDVLGRRPESLSKQAVLFDGNLDFRWNPAKPLDRLVQFHPRERRDLGWVRCNQHREVIQKVIVLRDDRNVFRLPTIESVYNLRARQRDPVRRHIDVFMERVFD